MTRALISARVNIQVLLMIRLCIPPFPRRQDLRNNLALPPLLVRQLCHLSCDIFLLSVVIEDTRSVLRARIRTLTIGRRRIMHLVEKLQKLSISDLAWIKRNLQRFRMAGPPRTHSPIIWTLRIAPNISYPRIIQSFILELLPIHVLNAPETACGDGGFLRALGGRDRCDLARCEAEHGAGAEGPEKAVEKGGHGEGH